MSPAPFGVRPRHSFGGLPSSERRLQEYHAKYAHNRLLQRLIDRVADAIRRRLLESVPGEHR